MADEPRSLPVPQAHPGAASNVGVALPQVPGRVAGGTAIQSVQNGLVWTINLKIGELGEAAAHDTSKTWVPAWFDDTDETFRISLADLSSSLPIAWANITGKPAAFPPTLPIAMGDVTGLTAALGGLSSDVSVLQGIAADHETRIVSLETTIVTKLGDAPSNANVYGRQGGAWVVVPALTDSNKGDITVTGTGANWTINANAVTVAKMQQLAGLSVLGNGANATADMAALTAGTDGYVLRRLGTALAFGTVATAGIADNAVTNAKFADMAAGTVKSNLTGSTADPADNTLANFLAALAAFVGDSGSGGTKGLVPAPAAGDAAKLFFLSAAGAFASPYQSGDVVQTREAEYTSYFLIDGGTSPAQIIPADDTIPQQTEGVEAITVSITPKFSDSKLRLTAYVPCSGSANSICAAVFRDSTAGAVASNVVYAAGSFIGDLVVARSVDAVAASATTFKLRVGPGSGIAGFNGNTVSRIHGGAQRIYLKVEEIKA